MKTYRLFFKDSSFVRLVHTYNFIGNGNWSRAANWSNNSIPPAVLPVGDQINIDPAGNGECILDIPQTVGSGSSLQIIEGKKLRILGNLTIKK
jgi:hypothetical protein